MASMSTAQKVIATAAIVMGFIVMAKCDTDSAHNQPSGSTTPNVVVTDEPTTEEVNPADDTGDALTDDSVEANAALTEMALEMAWTEGTTSDHESLCLLWNLDPESAMTFFNEGLNEDPDNTFVPDEFAVQEFFNGKC